jgi:hypothetical protein
VPRPTICLNSVIEPTETIEHDEPAGLGIHTRGEQAGCSC